MTTRLLPPGEWSRLSQTDPAAATVWPVLPIDRTQVLVVEHEGEIVGCWMLMLLPHLECLWIAEPHQRRAAVGRRLWLGMQDLVHDKGYPSVITGAISDDVRQLLAHVGAARLPGDQYLITFGKE